MSLTAIIIACIFIISSIFGIVWLLKPKEKNNKGTENTNLQASAPRINKEVKKIIGVVPHFG